MSTHPSLLERLRSPDDQSAWRAFDEQYRELILRYCQRRGLQAADAEDVRQVVLMGLAHSMQNFVYQPELGRFRDYLGKIVQNVIRRHLSRQGRSPERLLSDMSFAETPFEEDDAWHEEWMLHHYRSAMQQVRQSFEPQSLEVFDALLQGIPVPSLAARYQTTPEAIYKVKQRIRDRLREHIERQLREEDLSPRNA
jgi:RNA polymerase sigma factor (sigma-70 family)